MPFVLRCLLSLCLLCLALSAPAQTTLRNEQVQVELLAHAPQGVQAGQTFWLGLKIEHAPHWHTYWQNPGDSGLPTQLNWQLPAGLQAGEIAWPLPKKIPIGTLTNYGYEGSVLLSVPVTVTPQFQLPVTGKLRIALQAQWLVCRQECIPQEGQFQLDLPARSATALHGALFEAAQAATPTALSGQHSVHIADDGKTLQLRVEQLPAAWRGQTLALLPVTANVIHNTAQAGQDWTQQWAGNTWMAQVPVSPERSDSPTQMQWVLALGPDKAPQAPAVQVATPVQGRWPAQTAAAGVSPELARALEAAARKPAAAGSDLGLGLALLGALVGGLILNLMPCVFPVLAIKLLALVRPGTTEAQHRAAGLAYTLGMVLSFVLLGALMLALRATGEQLGWGFQLQSPGVVMALALLFTLMGLNLVGLFEFGQMLPSSLASLQNRHPVADAALSGVLAVAVASPCTAPFMGASLGLTLTLPAAQALAVFASVGLGMALPYLLASFWPALAHRLPRPGAWMQTFKQAMAFPMLATVVWLVWVLGQQTGLDSAAALLALLLLLAFGLWALTRQGRTRAVTLVLAALLLAGLVSQWPEAQTPAAGVQTPSASGERWQPWSAQAVRDAHAQGRPVFVDFTAAWCVTCQYNKKTVFSRPDVLAAFDAKQVVTLRADWTRRDAAISAELNALGRSGVPVYALYAPGKAPVLLSELPSATEVIQALP